MGNRSTVLKSCLTRVRPLKSLPVRSCPRVTCFPYGPPPCGHTRVRSPSTPLPSNSCQNSNQGDERRDADYECEGRVGDEERGGDEGGGAGIGEVEVHGGARRRRRRRGAGEGGRRRSEPEDAQDVHGRAARFSFLTRLCVYPSYLFGGPACPASQSHTRALLLFLSVFCWTKSSLSLSLSLLRGTKSSHFSLNPSTKKGK